jgi:hypothetical protein
MTTKREQLRATLHQWADELPIEEVQWLIGALRERDPVLYSLFTAPEDDEPETDEERAAVAKAREDIAAGRVMTTAELRRKLRR